MDSKLLNLLKLEAKEIKLSFEKASIEGEGTPQEVADRRERAVVNVFLQKYFPFPYRIAKGNIIDSYNMKSNSIDCIILNPSHPYTVDPKNDAASIIFADGVDFAIEIKPDFTNKTEIKRSLKQIQSIKKLRRRKNGIFFKSEYTKEQLEHYYQIPTFIFADKTYKSMKLLIEFIIDFYIEENIPLTEQFDFIVINNRAVLFNSYNNSYAKISSDNGINFAETNENTLATFLFLMNKTTKSEPTMDESVLSFYLDHELFSNELKTYDTLNKKLHMHLGTTL